MASKMRSAMQAERTLRAFTVGTNGRIHLTLDGANYLHRDYPQPGDSRVIAGTPAYLADIPKRENYCYACLRDNGPKADIMAVLGWVPIRDPKMARTTRTGALKGAETIALTSRAKMPKRATRRDAMAALAAGATPPPSESGPSRETVLARIAERLDALTGEQAALVALLRSLDGLPAPEPERESLHALQTRLNAGSDMPAELGGKPKRTGKARDGQAGAASDADVVQAAVRAWQASAGRPKSERNSAAYRALCAARPGMERETRESLWDVFKAERSA